MLQGWRERRPPGRGERGRGGARRGALASSASSQAGSLRLARGEEQRAKRRAGWPPELGAGGCEPALAGAAAEARGAARAVPARPREPARAALLVRLPARGRPPLPRARALGSRRGAAAAARGAAGGGRRGRARAGAPAGILASRAGWPLAGPGRARGARPLAPPAAAGEPGGGAPRAAGRRRAPAPPPALLQRAPQEQCSSERRERRAAAGGRRRGSRQPGPPSLAPSPKPGSCQLYLPLDFAWQSRTSVGLAAKCSIFAAARRERSQRSDLQCLSLSQIERVISHDCAARLEEIQNCVALPPSFAPSHHHHPSAPWWIFSSFPPQTTAGVAPVVVETTIVVFPAQQQWIIDSFLSSRNHKRPSKTENDERQ